MPVFVILAFALAVLAVAGVVLAALQLWTALSGLLDVGRKAATRLAPLAEELAQEVAVAGSEIEALGSVTPRG